jgi:hypothetical protein
MARTFKDDPSNRSRSKNGKRRDRGDNRGRRWGNDDDRATRNFGEPKPRRRDWRASSENDSTY